MNDTQKNGAEIEKPSEQSLYGIIRTTAVKTLIVALVVIALGGALLGVIFPKLYMGMYRQLGLYTKAAAYAEIAADRAEGGHAAECNGACEYMSLLSTGIVLAEMATDDFGSVERLYRMTEKYLQSGCADAHGAIMDAMAIREYGSGDAVTLSAVYGYRAYVEGENTYAACLSGRVQSQTTDLLARFEAQGAHDKNTLARAVRYTEYVNAHGVTAAYVDLAMFTGISEMYDGLKEYAQSLPTSTAENAAEKSSVMLRLIMLAEEMDKTENILLESDGISEELKESAKQDKFSQSETELLRNEYLTVVNTFSAKITEETYE